MRGTIAAVLAAVLLAGTGSTTAAPQQGGNLLANPGFEDGQGANDADTRFPVPGWEVGGSATAVRYGAPQFPTPAESARIGGGVNFLAGGPGSATSVATQIVSVAARAAEIDAGRLQATLGAALGGFTSQSDNATVTAAFRAETGAELGRMSIGPVTPAERNSQTSLLQRTGAAPVPAGTRSIQVTVTARRTEGTYNDGYADNVVLSLGAGTPPPVAGVSVNVAPVSGVVRVRLRGTNRFVNLARLRNVPVGSELDVTRGRVRLVSAAGARRTQTGVFYQGRAVVRQPRARLPVTTLEVSGPFRRVCPRREPAATQPPRTRRLWGNATGRFTTRGRFAAAAVRGTVWLTEDRCDGTLVRVVRGRVAVRDLVRNRTIIVRAGGSYLARARR